MPLTVNADDFGLNSDVNKAICSAFAKGLIHRTTLMVNMPFAKEAMDMARENGFADKVGIHLNLTAGRPLTKNMALNREMCDKDGLFTADFHRNTLKRFVLSKTTRRDITEELDAQIARYGELGGSLYHVDSHHHVHTDLSVLSALRPLIQKYGIRSIRLGRNLYHGGNILMRAYKMYLNRRLSRVNTRKSDLFGSVSDFEAYRPSPEIVKEKEIEIMVHPMFDDKGVLIDTDYPMSDMNKRLGGNLIEKAEETV